MYINRQFFNHDFLIFPEKIRAGIRLFGRDLILKLIDKKIAVKLATYGLLNTKIGTSGTYFRSKTN